MNSRPEPQECRFAWCDKETPSPLACLRATRTRTTRLPFLGQRGLLPGVVRMIFSIETHAARWGRGSKSLRFVPSSNDHRNRDAKRGVVLGSEFSGARATAPANAYAIGAKASHRYFCRRIFNRGETTCTRTDSRGEASPRNTEGPRPGRGWGRAYRGGCGSERSRPSQLTGRGAFPYVVPPRFEMCNPQDHGERKTCFAAHRN